MISRSQKDLLFIEPQEKPKPPLVDELTRKLTAAFRKARKVPSGNKGGVACVGCWDAGLNFFGDSNNYVLPNGLKTNSLAIHYLVYHREEVPQAELDKVNNLQCGEENPTGKEAFTRQL